MSKPLIYICSPLRGDYDTNIDNAIAYSGAAFRLGYIPITPHIYFTRFMNDENSKERSMAMDAGLQLLRMCSEVWVFGLDHPSEGMQAEIAEAIRTGIPVKETNTDGFVSLKELFENATVQLVPIRKEVGECQDTVTMKAIRILPHGKR